MADFCSVDHSSVLLKSLFVSEKYSDVTISAGKTGKCWNVHKGILAESSKYFDVMFSSSFKEASDHKIVLDDVDNDVLEATIQFLYCGKIKIADPDFAGRLLEQAHLMQISEIVKYCFEYLENNVSPENCIGFYLLAVKYNEKEKTKKFFQFAVDNFLKVIEFSEYFDLDFETLKLYLSTIMPKPAVEEGKVDTILKWIEHKPTIRISHIGECIKKLIDFNFVTNLIIFSKLHSICVNTSDLQYLNRQLIKIHCGPQILVICEKDQSNSAILTYNINKNTTYGIGEIPKNQTVLGVWNNMLAITTLDSENKRTINICDLSNFNQNISTYPLDLQVSPKDAAILDDDLYLMMPECIYKFELKSGALKLLRAVEDNYSYQSLAIFQRKLHLLLSDDISIKVVALDVDSNEWSDIFNGNYIFGPSQGSLIVDSNFIYYFNKNMHCFNLKRRFWTPSLSWNFTAVSPVRVGSKIWFANNMRLHSYIRPNSTSVGHPQAFINAPHPVLKLFTI